MIRDLQCGQTVVPDAIDMRVVDNLRNRYGFTLNDDFLSQMSSCHGGRPQIATFEVNGEQWPIGQFLTLLDNHSDLVPPSRPHFDHSDIDERAIDSINYLVDGEHSTSRALFEGLMPFAATAVEMCLDRAYVNLLCLDHRVAKAEPSVVMWLADEANEAYMDWDEEYDPFEDDDENAYRNVPWDTFLSPVSPSFRDFVQSLQ